MADHIAIPLSAIPTDIDSDDFQAVCGWPFKDQYVTRMLHDDIPQRVQFGNCRIWAYRDPSRNLVGFGTLDYCSDYSALVSGRLHPYVPLLAVNPTIKSLGFGTSILRHLIAEAVILSKQPTRCSDSLFLDVYTDNERAIKLYIANGFTPLEMPSIADPNEDGRTFIVMSRSVAIAPSESP